MKSHWFAEVHHWPTGDDRNTFNTPYPNLHVALCNIIWAWVNRKRGKEGKPSKGSSKYITRFRSGNSFKFFLGHSKKGKRHEIPKKEYTSYTVSFFELIFSSDNTRRNLNFTSLAKSTSCWSQGLKLLCWRRELLTVPSVKAADTSNDTAWRTTGRETQQK